MEYVSGISFPNLYIGYGFSVETDGNYFMTSTNSGGNWSKAPLGYQMYGVNFISNSTGWLVGIGGNILYTTNGGANFTAQNSGVTASLRRMFMLNSSTGWIVGDGGKILHTTTGGDTTTYLSISGQIRYNDNNEIVTSGCVKAIKFDSLSSQMLIVDSVQIQSNGTYSLSHVPPHINVDIMAFENDENEQRFVPTYYPSTTAWQSAVTLHTDSNKTGINIGVFRITNTPGQLYIKGHVLNDNGNTSVGLDRAIVYSKSGNLFNSYSLGSNLGAYNLKSLQPGSFNLMVDRIGYGDIGRTVVLTTFSKDTIDFVLSNYVIGVTPQNQLLPKSFWLGTNYPNPFNPSTKISFGLPESGRVKLAVYDMAGKEVAILLNDELYAGNFTLEWNASSYASGVYILQMVSGDFSDTRKLVLIK